MRSITLTDKETNFLEQYLDTAFWVADIEPQELDEDCHREATIDCLAFLSRVDCYLNDDNRQQAAHDFYLSRNGHGSGFWDRSKVDSYAFGNYSYSYKFQKIAESFGRTDYYTADGELLT
jgi:hypothetical protein